MSPTSENKLGRRSPWRTCERAVRTLNHGQRSPWVRRTVWAAVAYILDRSTAFLRIKGKWVSSSHSIEEQGLKRQRKNLWIERPRSAPNRWCDQIDQAGVIFPIVFALTSSSHPPEPLLVNIPNATKKIKPNEERTHARPIRLNDVFLQGTKRIYTPRIHNHHEVK